MLAAFWSAHGVKAERILNATPAEQIFYGISRDQYYSDASYIVANGIAVFMNELNDAAEKEKDKWPRS